MEQVTRRCLMAAFSAVALRGNRFDALQFAEAREAAKQMNAAAALLLVDGKTTLELGETTRIFPCHSVRKSYLSALFGPAVAAGKIRLDATLEDLGITDRTPLTAQEKRATVRHLLLSCSGVYLRSNLASTQMLGNLPPRDSHAPGTHWYYNNWDFNALGSIYQRATGEDVFSAFDRLLARPTGMQDWVKERDGIWSDDKESLHRGYEFRMSARDMAKFGQLMLQKGNWNGQQILPPAWIEESTRTHTKLTKQPGGYGYMWWTEVAGRMLPNVKLPAGSYSAQGNGGHMILIVPAYRWVLVLRANTYLPAWSPFGNARLNPEKAETFIGKLQDAWT